MLVSSAGADAFGKAFYLRVGARSSALTGLEVPPPDICRPGLLRGPRGRRRPLERLAILTSPLTDMLLHGERRRYRSIDARTVAAAALQLTREKVGGRFVHENDSIVRAARKLDGAG